MNTDKKEICNLLKYIYGSAKILRVSQIATVEIFVRNENNIFDIKCLML